MTAIKIDGRATAKKINAQSADKTLKLTQKGVITGLAVIMV